MKQLLHKIVFLLLFSSSTGLYANLHKDHNILLLHSYSPELIWTQRIHAGILHVLSNQNDNYTLVTEYLDSKRVFNPTYESLLNSLFKHKYQNSIFDLIILSDDDALRFMMKYGNELFPDVPVIYCGINVYDPLLFAQYPMFTGVLEVVELQSTLEAGLNLFPETEYIYLIGDKSTTAFDLSDEFKNNIAGEHPGLVFQYIHERTLKDLSPKLAKIPDNSLILLLTYVSLEGSKIIELEESASFISQNVQVPVLGLWEFTLGHGILGGKMVSGFNQGKQAAEMGLQVLTGKDPIHIPVAKTNPNQFFFDYKVLQKFHISPHDLPANSIVINKPVNIWEENKTLIQGFLFALAVSILLFLFYYIYSKKVKRVLRNELTFQQNLINALPNPICYTLDNESMHGCNKAFERLMGGDTSEIIEKKLPSIHMSLYNEQHKKINQEVYTKQISKTFEGQIVGSDNKIRDVIFYKSPLYDRKNKRHGVIETIIDITEKKKAEEVLRQSEERYTLAIQATQDGIFDWDLESNEYFVSERLKNIIGHSSKNKVTFEPESFENFVFPEDRALVRHHLQLIKDKLKESFDIEVRLLRKDGTSIWVDLQVFGLAGNNNEVIRVVGSVSDIQRRKDSELLMKRWEEVFRNTRMGIAIISPQNNNIELINPIFAQMHAYRSIELVGRRFEEFYTPELQPKFIDHIEKAYQQKHHVYESLHTRKDRSTFPAMIDITYVSGKSRDDSYIIINVQDITVRKNQEREIALMLQNEQTRNEELRSSEEELKQMLEQSTRLKEKIEQSQIQYAQFLDGSGDFAILKDSNLNFLQVNKAFATFFSKMPQDFLGKKDSDFLDKSWVKKELTTDTQVLNNKTMIVYENHLAGQYFEFRKFPVYYDKNETGIGIFVRNITRQKLIEQQLLHSERRFKTMLENSYDAITLIDAQGTISYCTDVIEKITDIPAQKLLGKNIRQLVHINDREMFDRKLKQTFQQKEIPVNIEYRTKDKGGNFRYIESIAVNYQDNPLIKGILITSRDVSVEHQSKELKKNIALAQKSAEIKQQFLSNMSHEIRTPMNGIVGMIEFLMQTNLDSKQKDYVETIKDSADSLLNIINDILDFSKIEAGKMNINPTPVNIKKFVSNIHKLFLALSKKNKIDFQIHIDDTLPEYLLLDSVRLNQVISNLLSNAIKFTPKGKVQLKILNNKTENGLLHLCIEVHDTGIGIKYEDQKKLFTSFSQIDSSFTRSQEGTGLGLAISQKIVQLMGGNLELKSTPDVGSVFWFTIHTNTIEPTLEEQNLNDVPHQNIEKLNLRILLVEDKVVNQKVITLMLNAMGCSVTIANNGREAIEIIENHKTQTPDSAKAYDIILMDIQMPVMDGITATRLVRQNHPEYNIIIGLSANVMATEVEDYIKSGLDDYIIKPTKTNDLYQKLLLWKSRLDKEVIVKEEHSEMDFLTQIAIVEHTIIKNIESQAHNNLQVLQEFYDSAHQDAKEILVAIHENILHENVSTTHKKLYELNNLAISMGALQLQKGIELAISKLNSTQSIPDDVLKFLEEAQENYFSHVKNSK